MHKNDADADIDVLIVGAGILGLYQLYRACADGFSVQLFEARDGLGGTWFWNRYPGARFDSESYTYAFLFSKELFEEWEWQEHFAAQPETVQKQSGRGRRTPDRESRASAGSGRRSRRHAAVS